MVFFFVLHVRPIQTPSCDICGKCVVKHMGGGPVTCVPVTFEAFDSSLQFESN